MSERIPGFSTLAIHAGAQPDPTTGARATPIYQTTSFVFESVDHAASLFGLQTFGNIYTRIGNPTNAVLEERVAALEGGTAGLAVASGHAAQVLVFHCLMQPGDEFVASKKLYGGSINQFNHAFKNFGWNVVWADPDDIASFERAVSAEDQGDLHRVDRQSRRRHHRHGGGGADRAARRRALHRRQHAGDAVSVQAVRARRRHRRAFADQISRRPRQFDRRHDRRRRHLQLVARAALSDAVASRGRNITASCCTRRSAISPSPSPAACWRCATSARRCRRSTPSSSSPASRRCRCACSEHCDNALAVAEWIVAHPKVAWVSYPGLPGDRYHNLAKKYCPKRRRRGVHLRAQGRLRRRRQARLQREAVLAPRQYRRHPLADHPSGLDHAPAAQPTRRRSRPAPAPTWCGSRSASRTRKTSSPTWSRRWRTEAR